MTGFAFDRMIGSSPLAEILSSRLPGNREGFGHWLFSYFFYQSYLADGRKNTQGVGVVFMSVLGKQSPGDTAC